MSEVSDITDTGKKQLIMINSNDIIRAFKQSEVEGFPDNSPDGNCVCIAWIKCAIGKYGLNNVFESIPIVNGYKVKLKDGVEMTVSNDEIAYANSKNGFILNKASDDVNLNIEIYNYSCFCFAVMAKKADILQDEINDFQKAVTFLNEGLNTFSGDKYLGLQNNSKEVSRSVAMSNNANVGRSPKHAFFTSFNSRGLYGRVDGFSSTTVFFSRWKFKTLF